MAHVLDAVVAGETPRTSYAEKMGLPGPTGWEPGRVWTEWDVDESVKTPWGAVFGGFLASVADELAGMAALTVLDEGQTFGTTELRISPLRPVREGRIRVEARVISRGRSTVHVEIDFHDQRGQLLARGGAIQVLKTS